MRTSVLVGDDPRIRFLVAVLVLSFGVSFDRLADCALSNHHKYDSAAAPASGGGIKPVLSDISADSRTANLRFVLETAAVIDASALHMVLGVLTA
jgi:hypothetical protein